MFTEIFGGSPRVRLLDFLADHVDFDYTLSQLQRFTGISRPTLYKLVAELEKERLVMFTREVGGSRFFRINMDDPRVVSMLQVDFSRVNEELMAGRFDDDAGTARRRVPGVKRVARKSRSAAARGGT